MVKILVADDDSVMLSLLSTLMQLEGNEVITVTRPGEVIPVVERERPALIMLDYHLAGGDVIETLVALKENPKLGTIPVLIASGLDREIECLRAGADGFILKPFRPAELLDTIQALLNGGSTPPSG